VVRRADDGRPAIVDLERAGLPDDDAEDGRGLAPARTGVDELVYEREGTTDRWHLVRRRSR
jgi:anti-sigma regulatory factor (Ser/Thr protein kinase)